MNKVKLVSVVLLMIVVFALSGCNQSSREVSADGSVSTIAPVEEIKYAFRYPDRLTEHFEKHGLEMGFGSEEEYLIAANAVIANPDALHELEAEDNDHVYFVEATGEIVFLSQDGYIRTYFITDKEYFERQAA